MSCRSEGRGLRDCSRGSGASHTGDAAVGGVKLTFVCRGVPVLTLDKVSVFYENASWMLQSALSSSGKAELLYEYFEDGDILAECCRLGLKGEDLSLVRLRDNDLKHVKAVGTTGKRSVMLAIVVALALEDDRKLGGLWNDLREYELDKAFVGLLESGKHAVSSRVADDSSCMAFNGVQVNIICGNVPVLSLEKDSVFHENVAWLLQMAMDSTGKADSFFEHCEDREILAECRRRGLDDNSVGIARMKLERLRNMKAVGTCGKRSIMLSLVVALIIHNEAQLDSMIKQVCNYSTNLEEPFLELVRFAKGNVNLSKEAYGSGWGHDGGSWDGKRKCGWEDGGWSSEWDSAWHSSAKAGKKRNTTRQHDEFADAESLNKQLDDYWSAGR